MGKSRFFIGQPVFSQILNCIPKSLVSRITAKYDSDRYVKRFGTYDHLVSMLYCSFQKCESLREVVLGLQAHMHKLEHLGLRYTPRRSTLSDANKRRSHEVFQDIFHELVKTYYPSLSDSSKSKSLLDELFIVDSTTITLFSDIMHGAGSYKQNGRKKGGVKAHVMISSKHYIPVFARITEAKENDQYIMNKLPLPAGSCVVFDKAYTNSSVLHAWTERDVSWVTRLRAKASVMSLAKLKLNDQERQQGVLSDQLVKLGRRSNRSTKEMLLRLVFYYDAEKKRHFHFLTNNFEYSALQIAQIYKRRWQIELLFKRFKATKPLRYFLGNNPNAIKIQIWCALIADLITQIIRSRLNKKHSKWSFSNLASVIRQQLFSYFKLIDFLTNPSITLLQNSTENMSNDAQLNLFDTS